MPKHPRSNAKAKAVAKKLPAAKTKPLGQPGKGTQAKPKHPDEPPPPHGLNPVKPHHSPEALAAAEKEKRQAAKEGKAAQDITEVPPGDGPAKPIGPVEPNPKPVVAPAESAKSFEGVHGDVAREPRGDEGNPVGPAQAEKKPEHRTRRVATPAEAITGKAAQNAIRDAKKLSEAEAADKAALNHEIHANRQKAHDAVPELPLPQDDSNPRPEALPRLKEEIAKTVAIVNASSNSDLPRETLLAMRGEPEGSPLEAEKKKDRKTTMNDTTEGDPNRDARDGRVPVSAPPASAAEDVKLGKGPWTFIKNHHLNERVILPGGREFVFAKTKIVTTDKELAAGLTAVAARHNILIP